MRLKTQPQLRYWFRLAILLRIPSLSCRTQYHQTLSSLRSSLVVSVLVEQSSIGIANALIPETALFIERTLTRELLTLIEELIQGEGRHLDNVLERCSRRLIANQTIRGIGDAALEQLDCKQAVQETLRDTLQQLSEF